MVMTNSTYDGLCYNVDAIKQLLGDTVDVLHFDEAWYAYANFHEFYDGYHAHLVRTPGALDRTPSPLPPSPRTSCWLRCRRRR